MGRKTTSNPMTSLANQHTNGDEKELASMINTTFQSVSSSLPKLSPRHQCNTTPLPDRYCVSVEDVEKKLMAIKVSKACGPDLLPNWVLRDFAGYLSKPIASIFNSSFREGYVPTMWKSADIVPLPKVKPTKKLDKDLRPISLTPAISKVQESFMHGWIWEVIKDNLDKWQFGAIKREHVPHMH